MSMPFFVPGMPRPQSLRATPAPGSRIKPVGPERLNYRRIDELNDLYPPPAGLANWNQVSPVIRDFDAFCNLWSSPPQPVLPGPISRLVEEHVEDIARMGIFSYRSSSHRDCCVVNTLFAVFKDQMCARLIMWPKHANDLMRRPPKCRLPGRDEIHGAVLRFCVAAEDDGSNWFYRFPIAPSIQPFFAARLPGLGIIFLTVLCMGWTWSMIIAHTASEIIARASAARVKMPDSVGVIPYADNFLLGACSRRAGRRLLTAWTRVTRYVNAPMKGKGQLRMRPRLRWLGLDLDLRSKTIAANPELVSTLAQRISHMEEHTVSHLFIWECFGVASYYAYMLRRPLCFYPALMQWIRRRARFLHRHPELWNGPARIWPSALRDLRRVASDIAVPAAAAQDLADTSVDAFLYTDASKTGGASILFCDSVRNDNYRWEDEDLHRPIHQLEAIALLRGLQMARRYLHKGSHVVAYCDNQAVVYAFAKGNAKDPLLAGIIADIILESTAGGIFLEVKWVPSESQLADALSREQ